MGIEKLLVLTCDVKGCDHKTPLLEYSGEDGEDERIRAEQGFSFVDVPFANHNDLYLCQGCLEKIVEG